MDQKDSKQELLRQAEKNFYKNTSFRYTNMRYLALLLMCFLMVGSYYCFDNPSALQRFLQQKDKMNLTAFQFNLLYSVYSFPNIILPFIGGFLLDKIGVRFGIFIFTLILIVGQSIFTLGGIYENYPLMLAGRVVFGMGGECLVVTQSLIVTQWFKDDSLALAMGFNISFSRLGSTLNSNLTPYFYEQTNNFLLPMAAGIFFCFLSFLAGLILIWMDKESDRREGIKHRTSQLEEQVETSDLKKFSFIYWILVLNCALIYGAFFTFTSNANDFLGQMYNISPTLAGQYLSAIFLISAIITPFFGFLVDKFGRIGYIMLVSLCLFLGSHIIFLSLQNDIKQTFGDSIILVPLCMMGLFYATYAAVFWPCIPLVVDKNLVGTAYGVVNSVQNINLALSPMIYGAVHDATQNNRGGYFWAEIFLVSQVLIGIISTIALNIWDSKTGSKLNEKPKINHKFTKSRLSMLK